MLYRNRGRKDPTKGRFIISLHEAIVRFSRILTFDFIRALRCKNIMHTILQDNESTLGVWQGVVITRADERLKSLNM